MEAEYDSFDTIRAIRSVLDDAGYRAELLEANSDSVFSLLQQYYKLG